MTNSNDNESLKSIINEYSTESSGTELTTKKMDQKCAPTVDFNAGSCIPLDILICIAEDYNKNNKNKQIELDKEVEMLYPKKYKKYLVEVLTEKLADRCDNQRCWLTLDYAKNVIKNHNQKLTEKYYRPIGPQGQFTWLNTININQVMGQYQEKYPNFMFLGAVPIDFYEIIDFFQDLTVDTLLENGKQKIGIIYNLDKHNQPGSHWVAGFIDLEEPAIYYYDSYATRPNKYIREFYAIMSDDIKKTIGKTPKLDYNKTRHQYGDSECGMFSLYFILLMLKGKTLNDVAKTMPDDNGINKLRNELFIVEEDTKPIRDNGKTKNKTNKKQTKNKQKK